MLEKYSNETVVLLTDYYIKKMLGFMRNGRLIKRSILNS